MKKLLLLVTAASALLVTACGPKEVPNSARVNNAPTDASKTGLLVSNVTEADLANTLNLYPEMKVRLINKHYGLFEVFQVSESGLQNALGPEARIRPNSYIRLTDHPAKSFRGIIQVRREFKSAMTDMPAAKTILDNCLEDKLSEPTVQVTTKAKMDRFEFSRVVELNDSVTYSSKGSSSKDGSAIETLWIVRPANYSKMPVSAFIGEDLTFKPDTTGEYVVITVIKDKRGVCAMAAEPLYVTANPKFDKSRAMSEDVIARVTLTRYWQLAAVDAEESWKLSNGEGITVAIVDTGVDYNHSALNANIAVNLKEISGNGIDDDGNGFIDDTVGYDFGTNDAFPFDDYGHGTHCAGISASPVIGIAKGAKILPVKVGAGPGMDIGSVVGGIIYAVDNGARVINLSLGFEEDFSELRHAIEYAREKGVIVVAAAGNGDEHQIGVNNDELPTYPASYDLDNLISVAATNARQSLSSYSNFGVKSVHIAAPGGDKENPVLSTYKENAQGRELEIMSGTSMAAPAVVGVVAQALSLRPTLAPLEVRELLMATGEVSPSLNGKIKSGRIANSLGVLRALTGNATTTLARP